MRKRKITKRRSNYPESRKKKRAHAQFINYNRVIEKWGIVPDIFFMFKIDDIFHACQPDTIFDGNIIIDGCTYRSRHESPDYDGQEGDMVYGYIAIIYHSNMAPTKSRFVFMKDPVMDTGHDLSRFLGLKNKIGQQNHIKFYIWA
jgi:hypothetical protein